MLNIKYLAYVVIALLLSIVFAQYHHGKAIKAELRAEQENVLRLSESIKDLNHIIAKNDLSIKQLMQANESLNKHFTRQRNEFKRVKQNDKAVSDWSAVAIPEPIKRLYERPERTGVNGYRQ